MNSKMKQLNGIVCAVFCAFGALSSLGGAPEPWGWSYRGGTPVDTLTNRTESGGILLSDGDLSAGVDEVRFKAGRLSVNRIAVSGRKLAFAGAEAGTTLTRDKTAVCKYGGAIYAEGGSITITNLVFDDFYAEYAGGAVMLRELTGDALIADCRFVNCRAALASGAGGAVYASADLGLDLALRVSNTSFERCQAANGGAITSERIFPYYEKSIAVELYGCSLLSNSATYSGGALWLEGDAGFEATLFEGNMAGSDGGAVCAGSSDVEYSGSEIYSGEGVIFRGNVAHEAAGYAYGGAIALMNGGIDLLVERTAFLTNTADLVGGAIYAYTNSAVTISTSIFSNNVVAASDGFGGALSLEFSLAAITNTTVRGSNCGALDFYNSDAEIVNCVSVGNGGGDVSSEAENMAPTLKLARSAYGTLVADDAVAVTKTEVLEGRTTDDYDGETLRLKGTPAYNPVAAEGLVQTATDFDGVAYGSLDYGHSMGAYECATVASVSSYAYSGTYDGVKHTISVDAGTANIAVTWEYATAAEGPWYADIDKASFEDAGTYWVWAKASADVFKNPMVTSNTVTIAKRAITFKCPTLSKPYDGTKLTFSAEDMQIGGSNYAPADADIGFDYDFASITEIGTCASTVTCSDNGRVKVANYDISVTEGDTLTITPRKTDMGVESATQTWVYDGNSHKPDSPGYKTYNTENLLDGDTLEVVLDGVSITEPGVKANSIKSVRVMRGDVDVTSSYSAIVATTGILTVVKASLSETDVEAVGVEALYDGNKDKRIAVTVKNDLAKKNNAKVWYSSDSVNWYEEKDYPSFRDAGTYTVYYKVTADHFNDYFGAATVKINPRSVTFTSPSSNAVWHAGIVLSTDVAGIKVSGDGFVGSEFDGVKFTPTASITEAGAKTQATFTWKFDGARVKSINYSVAEPVYGWLEIFPQGTLVVTSLDHEFTYAGTAQKWEKCTISGEKMNPSDDIKVKYLNGITNPSESPVSNEIDVKVMRDTVDVTDEYVIEKKAGSLTMKNLSLDGIVSAKDVSKIYDAAPTNITVVIDKSKLPMPKADDDFTFEYRTSDTEPWSAENPVFTNKTEATVHYRVSVKDYDTYEGSAKLTIALRPVKLVSASATATYFENIELRTNEVWIVDGDGLYDMAPGEFLEWQCNGVATKAGDPVDNTFSYGVTNALGTADLWKNYDFTIVPGSLKIDYAAFQFQIDESNYMYDGTGHGLALKDDKLPADAKKEFSLDGQNWQTTMPELTNVDTVVVYMRLTRDNYTSVTTTSELKVYPRPITLTPPNFHKSYDGKPLSFVGTDVQAGGNLFATGECFDYYDFAEITDVGRIPSTFSYRDSADGKTKVSNYSVSITPDRWLEVLPSNDKIVIRSGSYYGSYDGLAHDGRSSEMPDGYEVIDNDRLVPGDTVEVTLDGNSVTSPSDGIVSNTFTYAIKRAGNDVTADYTNVVKVVGTLQVVNADFSDRDIVANGVYCKYDGTGKKIDVTVSNPLAPVFGVRYSTDGGETWTDDNPPFTNVCEKTVHYVVSAANFNPYTNSVSVTITRRTVCFESKNDWKFYDGNPLEATNIVQVLAGYDGFATGEGLKEGAEAFANRASITQKGECEASFEIVPNDRTDLANYQVTLNYGRLYIYSTDGLTLVADSEEFTYDGKTTYTCKRLKEVSGLQGDDKVLVDQLDYPASISHPDQSPVANWIRRSSVKIVNRDGNDVTADYGTIALVDGQLTMRKLSIDDCVTADDVTKVYDAEATNVTVRVDTSKLPDAVVNSLQRHYSTLPNAGFGTDNLSFTKAGTYTVYYYVSADGCFDTQVKSATVTVKSRNIRIVSIGATNSYNEVWALTNHVYVIDRDEEAERYGLVDGHYLDITFTGAQAEVGESENTFRLAAITNAVADDSLKDNYFVTYGYGILKVTPASQQKDDPSSPDGYDYIGVYDGEGHSINPFTVTKPSSGVTFWYSTNSVDWTTDVLYCTNVCDRTRIWIKSVAPNYADIVTNGCVTITQRVVTVASGNGSYAYDGFAHSNATFEVTGDTDFVKGEGITGKDYATITTVGESGKSNTFGYDFNANTLKENYSIIQQWGVLTMIPGKMPDPETPVGPSNPKDPNAGPYPGPNLPPAVDPVPPVPTNNVDGTWSKLSDYDVVTVYDGAAHTFDVAALSNVVKNLSLNENPYEFAYSMTGANDTWSVEPFSFTNVTATSFWYRVAVPNYTNYIHAVGVTITNRHVTIETGSNVFAYNGEPQAFTNLTVETADAAEIASGKTTGFVPGEGLATTTDWATVCDSGDSKANTFDYTLRLNEAEYGSTPANYALDFAYGTIAVTNASVRPIPPRNPDDPTPPAPEPSGAWAGAANIVKCFDGFGTNVVAVYGGFKPTDDGVTVLYSTNGMDFVNWESLQFTNVCDQVKVEFIVSKANYSTITNSAYVTITNAYFSPISADTSMEYNSTSTNIVFDYDALVKFVPVGVEVNVEFAVDPSISTNDYTFDDAPSAAPTSVPMPKLTMAAQSSALSSPVLSALSSPLSSPLSSLVPAGLPAGLSWTNAMPRFVNVCTNDLEKYTVYYRVQAANYEPYYGSNTVEITRRTVQIIFPVATKQYDGTTNLTAGVKTNLYGTAQNMVGEEEFLAFGSGVFTNKSAMSSSQYFSLTGLVVEAWSGALFRNYIILYGSEGKGKIKSSTPESSLSIGREEIEKVPGTANIPGSITPRQIDPGPSDPEGTFLVVSNAVKVYDGVATNIYRRVKLVDGDDPNIVKYHYAVGDKPATTAFGWYDWVDFTNVTYDIAGNVASNLVWCWVEAENYLPTTNSAYVLIQPRPITVQANFQSMTYDDVTTLTPGFNTAEAWSDATAGVADKGLADGESIAFVDLAFDREISAYTPDMTNENAIVTNAHPVGAVFVISNSTQEVTLNYDIDFKAGNLWVYPNDARFTVSMKWVYAKYLGTFLAQINVTNINKAATFAPVEWMRFYFADRKKDGKVNLQLWDSTKRAAVSDTSVIGGETYRWRALEKDFWLPGEAHTFGPSDEVLSSVSLIARSFTTTAELKSLDYVSPSSETYFEDYVSWFGWCSAGKTNWICFAKGVSDISTPVPQIVSLPTMNRLAALGVTLASAAEEPSCEISEFTVDGDRIFGSVRTICGDEVGLPTDGAEVELLGADAVNGTYETVATVAVDSDGAFEVTKPKDKTFFKVRISVKSEIYK